MVLDPLRDPGSALFLARKELVDLILLPLLLLPPDQVVGEVHRLAGHATPPIRPNWNLFLSSSSDFRYSRSRFACCSMNATR
jgi:hypothetical protein